MTRHAVVHGEAGLERDNSSLALRANTPVGSLCKPFWLRPGPTETSLRQKFMAARHALVCHRIRASLEGRELGRRVTFGAPFCGFGPAQQQVVRAQQAPDSLCTPLPCSQGSSTCQSPYCLNQLGCQSYLWRTYAALTAPFQKHARLHLARSTYRCSDTGYPQSTVARIRSL